MESQIVSILVAIGLILFAVFKSVKLIQQILKKSKSESWQVSSAEVLSKQVTKRISTRSGASYYPEIAYRYAVMGQRFEKTIRLAKYFSQQKAQEKVDDIGKTIEVRYNPNQPKEHVSEYDIVNYPDILLIVIMLVLAGIMLYPYLQ
ncbi:MAG: hypothetical protein CVU41_12290 [Chloroflexi bacterium HGW-Chloroflexi-3]|nr:MAG: hypothetical protein CVU41_12290 [Chloroflexi bacterium HGW-Chloroflexi-3]